MSSNRWIERLSGYGNAHVERELLEYRKEADNA